MDSNKLTNTQAIKADFKYHRFLFGNSVCADCGLDLSLAGDGERNELFMSACGPAIAEDVRFALVMAMGAEI